MSRPCPPQTLMSYTSRQRGSSPRRDRDRKESGEPGNLASGQERITPILSLRLQTLTPALTCMNKAWLRPGHTWRLPRGA